MKTYSLYISVIGYTIITQIKWTTKILGADPPMLISYLFYKRKLLES